MTAAESIEEKPKSKPWVVFRICRWWYQLTVNFTKWFFGWDTDTEWFDPEKGYLSLGVVNNTGRIWVGVVLVLTGIMFSAAWGSTHIDWSLNGFNFFFKEMLSVPLTFVITIVPVLALYAAAHRSEQTKRQIELAESVETSRLADNHIRSFDRALTVKKFEGLLQFVDSHGLHGRIFPRTSNRDFGVDGKFSATLLDIITRLINNIAKQSKGDNRLLHLEGNFSRLCNHFGCSLEGVLSSDGELTSNPKYYFRGLGVLTLIMIRVYEIDRLGKNEELIDRLKELALLANWNYIPSDWYERAGQSTQDKTCTKFNLPDSFHELAIADFPI